MISFPVVASPSSLGDRFLCTTLHGSMTARTCLLRQVAKWQGPGVSVHPWCGSGKCEQGNAVRLAVGDFAPPRYTQFRQPEEYALQSAARRKKEGRGAAKRQCARPGCLSRPNKAEALYCSRDCRNGHARAVTVASLVVEQRRCLFCRALLKLGPAERGCDFRARNYCDRSCANSRTNTLRGPHKQPRQQEPDNQTETP